MFIKYGDSQERILKEETRKLALNTFLLSTSFYDKKFRGGIYMQKSLVLALALAMGDQRYGAGGQSV